MEEKACIQLLIMEIVIDLTILSKCKAIEAMQLKIKVVEVH